MFFSCGDDQRKLNNLSKETNETQEIESKSKKNQTLPQEEKIVVKKSSKYSFESFETPNIGWGYSIFEGTKELIRQPHIPAIQGNQGFATKDQADRVAKEVIRKLENGIMPPTLSIEEMQKLGAI